MVSSIVIPTIILLVMILRFSLTPFCDPNPHCPRSKRGLDITQRLPAGKTVVRKTKVSLTWPVDNEIPRKGFNPGGWGAARSSRLARRLGGHSDSHNDKGARKSGPTATRKCLGEDPWPFAGRGGGG